MSENEIQPEGAEASLEDIIVSNSVGVDAIISVLPLEEKLYRFLMN